MPSKQQPLTKRSGIAVLFVLAVLCITLAITYALSRSSVTAAALSRHESGGLRAITTAESSVTAPFVNLTTNPNWMPSASVSTGSSSSADQFQLMVDIADNGDGRILDTTAQVYEVGGDGSSGGSRRPLADQHLNIRLYRQTLNDLPTAAIAAFAVDVQNGEPPVYVAAGTNVRGDVRSRGPIYFQQGFTLAGNARVMGNVSRSGTSARRYATYRASWGSTYQAKSLDSFGQSIGQGRLQLTNTVLGPSSDNPMGVFYLKGANLVLHDNVTINGTIAVEGTVTITGNGVRMFAVQQVQVPTLDESAPGTGAATVTSVGTAISQLPIVSELDDLVTGITYPAAETVVKSTFPTLVADGDITVTAQADAVRVSGLILTEGRFRRDTTGTASLLCGHNHSLLLDQILDPLTSLDGPAVYIRGAIMAERVKLDNRDDRPFALVFSADPCNVRDAPGFFTWRVKEWRQAN